jgi:hypothetical protein
MRNKARPAGGDGGPRQEIERKAAQRNNQSTEPTQEPHSPGECLPFHPLAGIFPLLEGAEFEQLVADIKHNGLREKIDTYEGKIVDGRNRYRALQQLGIDPSAEPDKYFRKALYTHTVGGEVAAHEQSNDDRMRAYIVSKNAHRRHLTAEQKRDAIASLLKAAPEKSNRQIAETVKASHVTVGAVRTEMESTGQIDQLKKTRAQLRVNRAQQDSRPP